MHRECLDSMTWCRWPNQRGSEVRRQSGRLAWRCVSQSAVDGRQCDPVQWCRRAWSRLDVKRIRTSWKFSKVLKYLHKSFNWIELLRIAEPIVELDRSLRRLSFEVRKDRAQTHSDVFQWVLGVRINKKNRRLWVWMCHWHCAAWLTYLFIVSHPWYIVHRQRLADKQWHDGLATTWPPCLSALVIRVY